MSYSLVQSGQRLLGNHFPDAPQLHTAYDCSCWVKSHLSLQNGAHIRPRAQSSQALAPFLGGGSSMQSFAK